MKEKIQALYESVVPYLISEGKNATPVSYMDVYRFTQKEVVLPEDVADPYLFLVVKGSMRLHSIEGVFDYEPGQYFISAIHSPRTGEVLNVSQTDPFIALRIEFSAQDVISVMLDIDGDLPERLFDETVSAALPHADDKLTEVLLRLLGMTQTELSFMEKHLKREIIFDLLTGPQGRQFMQRIVSIGQAGDIYNVNNWIKQNYKTDFAVEDLAGQSNMSLSNFHQKFKSAVCMGPLQCQKKLRLTEARRLMLDRAASVTDAALEVGYESVSQFIRDYRRMFGRSPQKDIQEIRDCMET